MKVSIVHWRIRSWGGAEYLITKVAEVLGIKKIYTLLKPETENPFGNIKFVELYQNLNFIDKLIAKLGRVAEYYIWENFDIKEFDDCDLLLSSGSTVRAIITPDDVVHVNYCHSPPRWFYDLYHIRLKNVKFKIIYRIVLSRLRLIDACVDRRVDYYLVNSPIIKRRLWKYLKREAKILYPPIDLKKYKFKEFGDFYLYLGRLDHEKGVVEVVKAFKKLKRKLILAGGVGSAYSEVMELIRDCKNIEYIGFVSEEEKLKLLSECRAVVFNAINEDFGIVPIEANASGKPCITVNSGFPGIFVKDGLNGILHDGTVGGIIKGIERFEKLEFDPERIKKFVTKFDLDMFRNKLKAYLKMFYHDYMSRLEETDYEGSSLEHI